MVFDHSIGVLSTYFLESFLFLRDKFIMKTAIFNAFEGYWLICVF